MGGPNAGGIDAFLALADSLLNQSWLHQIGTSGDDEALLDDFTDLGCANGDATSYTISGLPDDDYEIYTYAWASDGAGLRTDITVTGSPDPLQIVGGDWTGSHVMGVTYARGIEADCGCFGLGEPITPATLTRDSLLFVLAVFLAIYAWRREVAGSTAAPPLPERSVS